MLRKGDVIENPVTGETLVFLRTPVDTGGELLQVEAFVAPEGGFVGEHAHPRQDETILVRRGELTLRVQGADRVLRAGQRATVPAGTPHAWRNSGDGELHAIIEFRSPGRIGDLITNLFALARTGHVDARGMPGPLQAAVTLHEYRDVMVVTGQSEAVRRYLVPLLAFAGRLLGLRPDYPYPRRSRVLRGMEIWRLENVAVG